MLPTIRLTDEKQRNNIDIAKSLTAFPGEIAESRPDDWWTMAIALSELVYLIRTPTVGPPLAVS